MDYNLASGVSPMMYESERMCVTSTHLASGVSPMRGELKKLGALNPYFYCLMSVVRPRLTLSPP